MEPEISHRCQKCGAAFRKGAQFCPQCGAEVGKSETDAALQDVAAMPDTINLAGGKRTKRGSNAPTQPFKPEMVKLPFVLDRPAGDQVESAPRVSEGVQSTKAVVASDESHSKRQRVKDAALEIVAENVRPSVEKLRHASSVVFEEAAAIDPSVRFVLIAIFLFVVFAGLLVLSFIR